MHARRFARAQHHGPRALFHALFKPLHALSALLFGLLALAPGQARADAPLAIEEAVRLTLANNELSLKAAFRVDAADGQLDKARAAFLPTLALSGSEAL